MAQALRFYQLHDGYAYNSDSLLLLDFAASFLTPNASSPRTQSPKLLKLLDMGAGCGILGISCALHFGAQVVAIERDPIMARLAHINARTNLHNLRQHFPHSTHSTNIVSSPAPHTLLDEASQSHTGGSCEVICADFLDPSTPSTALLALNSLAAQSLHIDSGAESSTDSRLESSAAHCTSATTPTTFATSTKPATSALAKPRFDALIANPPFYHDGSLESTSPRLALARYERALPLRAWIAQSKRLLTPRGALIFCYQANALPRVLESLAVEGFTCEQLRLVHPLINRTAKLALLYARLDSRARLSILPPLITHNSPEQSDFTQEVAGIYARYRTHSIKVYANDVLQ